MVAKDIMTKDVITVSPLTTVKTLAKILAQAQISGAPVIDKKGRVLGIVPEADIIGKRGRQVKSIMTKKVISVCEGHRSRKLPPWLTLIESNEYRSSSGISS
ncbi:MAG: CBS domain-containing protein [Deltaproteobacteria bacterium]|nr:CBS domain-containing protein [Deltaproteobacteria bacterium]